MGLIPDETIAQVIDRNNIVETIGSYFPLKRAGRNFKAPCPFHNEKTPSFVVNPDKQIFHCFGCGVGGNVIRFVMLQEHVEFPEAVRMLAQKSGISIPEDSPQQRQAQSLRQTLAQVNSLAVEFFHKNLLSPQDPAAKQAVAYLKGRDVAFETVKLLQLGFAPERWDGLLEYLRKKNIAINLIEKAGLVLPQKSRDGFYDRFRNRIIFPIFDIKSQCIAFGARAMEQTEGAKYLNSPETPLYTKGHHLYGLQLAKDAIVREDSAIVVEGYMDFLMPYQMEVKNVVASLGTALTVEQIRLLRRFTHNVVMLFDADAAGEAAMLRSLDLLIEEDMNVRVAGLAQGEDPDSFLRQYGVEGFKEKIKNSKTLFDYKLDKLRDKYGDKSIESRAKIVAEMLPTIHRFRNEVVKSGYLNKLSSALSVPEDALRAEYQKSLPRAVGNREGDGLTVHQHFSEQIRAVEHKMLRLLLEENDLIPQTRSAVDLSDFYDARMKMVLQKVFELFDRGQKITAASLMSCFSEPEVLQLISGLMASDEEFKGDREKIHRDFVDRIRQDRLKLRRKDLSQQIRQAEESGDQEALNKLKTEFNQLIKA